MHTACCKDRNDLVETIVKESAKSVALSLQLEFQEDKERVCRYFKRLKEVRARRVAMQAAVGETGDSLEGMGTFNSCENRKDLRNVLLCHNRFVVGSLSQDHTFAVVMNPGQFCSIVMDLHNKACKACKAYGACSFPPIHCNLNFGPAVRFCNSDSILRL